MPQLTDATVTRRPTDVVLAYEVDGDLPTNGTWLLSTTITGGENGPIHQFGVKALDGRIIAAFIFDHVTGHQHNYPQVNPDVRGTKHTVVFPVVSHDVATSGTWTATLNIDGTDVDEVTGSL